MTHPEEMISQRQSDCSAPWSQIQRTVAAGQRALSPMSSSSPRGICGIMREDGVTAGEERQGCCWPGPAMRSGQSHREKDMPTSCHDMLRNRRDPGALEECWELRIRRGPSGSALEPAGPGTDSRGLPGGGEGGGRRVQ